jgi:hypothetical protein
MAAPQAADLARRDVGPPLAPAADVQLRGFSLLTATAAYHFAGGVCTRVTCRASGRDVPEHTAVGMALVSAFRLDGRGALETHRKPAVGDCVCLFGKGRSFVTAPLEGVLEPG